MTDQAKTVDALLAERGTTHGEFSDHAQATQEVMRVWQSFPGYDKLPDIIKETLHMISHKCGRIVTGNPYVADHFDDIAGYARLVSQRVVDKIGLKPEHERPRFVGLSESDAAIVASEPPSLNDTMSATLSGVARSRSSGRTLADVMAGSDESPKDAPPLRITAADVGMPFRQRDGAVGYVVSFDGECRRPVRVGRYRFGDYTDHCHGRDGKYYDDATMSSLDLVERLDA